MLMDVMTVQVVIDAMRMLFTHELNILGLAVDTNLTSSKHIQMTQSRGNNTLKIIKALAATICGKFKETLQST